MSCKMYTLSLTGRKRAVCVNSEEELKNMTLKEFVRRFCPEEEDLENCRYIFEGKQLEGDRTLGYYGIKHGSTINTVLRLCGGGAITGPDGDEDGDEDEDEDGDEDEDEDGDGDEDEDEGMSRTESMDRLASMQQTEPESSSSCCMM